MLVDMTSDRGTADPTARTPEGPGESTGSFEEAPRTPWTVWTFFALGWAGYGGLVFSAVLSEGVPLWPDAVLGSALSTAPHALAAAVVVVFRHRLFRPDLSLARQLRLQLGVALAYTVVVALTSEGLFRAVQLVWYPQEHWFVPLLFRFLNAFFLYLIVGAFLMWAEGVRRVQESRTVIAREAELRARAEARALRAQFNPHFVFNTLHSLMLLVRADPPAAERAIEDVAELIRYASILQREEIDAVPVFKEVAVAERYAALEELRLEDRLTVEWEVDEAARPCRMPAFALQTLLENAIKHGLSPRPEGGTVRVSVRREQQPEGGRLRIEVTDDGEGAPPEDVEVARGRGLDLVRQRLESLYGEAARLDWETAPGEGFRVRLEMPAETAPPEGALRSVGRGAASVRAT